MASQPLLLPPGTATTLLNSVWARVILVVAAHVPLLLVVILVAPALVILPLFKSRSSDGRALICLLHRWSRDILDRCAGLEIR